MLKPLALVSIVVLALIPITQAQTPRTAAASAVSDGETTWVLTNAGGIQHGRSSLPVKVTDPIDLALGTTGDLVVAHNGKAGAQLSIFDSSGEHLRSIETDEQSYAQRVVQSATGKTFFLTQSLDGLTLRPFDEDWNAGEPFPVGGRCPANSIEWNLADLAVDGQGALWVADIMACGITYTIRKYDADGTHLATIVGQNQFSEEETDDSSRTNVAALIDIFASEDRLFVVLGNSSPGGRGILLDVWTLAGEYVERSEVVGPDLYVRGSVSDGQLSFVSLRDPHSALVVPQASVIKGVRR